MKHLNKEENKAKKILTTILTNPSFLLKFFDDAFQACLAYYQVIFNTDEQFLFYNFIMILKGNKLTRLVSITFGNLD